MALPRSPREYIRRASGSVPRDTGDAGAVRRADRLLAMQLHQRGVPLKAVENAFVLAAARRIIRPAEAPPLGTVRSLAYFVPVIEEVLQLKVGQEYFQHLRHRLQRDHLGTIGAPLAIIPKCHSNPRAFGADNIACCHYRGTGTPSAWTIAL